MRGIYLTIATVALMACSENGVRGDENVWPDNQVPDEKAERVTDEYVQSHPTQADVLFVISNWWSMEQAYAELVDSFDELLEVFIDSGVDYHIGVISTDTDHAFEMGKLHSANGVRYIDINNPDPMDTFAQMATMNASGCVGPRRPRDATYLALEVQGNDHNAGFRREDASMHTVFVSDDRDMSHLVEFEEWVSWYNTAISETPEIDTLSTIVDFSKDGLNLQASDMIGGASHPISDRPWANVLEEIGLKAQGLRREYFLSAQPNQDTINVVVVENGVEYSFDQGPVEEDGDWLYNQGRNSIQFNTYEPKTDSLIRISYEKL